MTGILGFGRALANIDSLTLQQSRIADLSNQLASGKKTNKFTGLESDVLQSKRARATIETIETFNTNITNTKRRLALMQDAITGFKEQAKAFQNTILNLSKESDHQIGEIVYFDDPATTAIEQIAVGNTSAESDVDLAGVVDFAENIYGSLIDLLNVQDSGRYLLSGADTANQPVRDTGTLDAAIGTLLNDWKDGTITTNDLMSDLQDRETSTNPNAIMDGTIGYSAELNGGDVGDVFVRASEGLEIKYTSLANNDAFRDVLVAVAYIKNDGLTPIVDTYIPPNDAAALSPDVNGAPGDTALEQKENFYAVMNMLTASVNEAIDKMDLELFKLSTVEARIINVEKEHGRETLFLEDLVADAEDIDANEIALKLNAALTSIESSYAVTQRVQSLSLVNFL